MEEKVRASALDLFSLKGKTAVVTGGGGGLGTAFCRALAQAGARIWVADLREEAAAAVSRSLQRDGLDAGSLTVNVLDRKSLDRALEKTGVPDVLLNAAGGNMAGATTSPESLFFDLPLDSLEKVVSLNLFGGAILPSQVFARGMKDNPEGGVILNVSSMSAFHPLTRIPGYSAAKAAVSNFTQWLAVHLAQEYNPRLRVNAIAPGFFLTDQNRFLLTEPGAGNFTERGKQILAHTPMNRFGVPEDLMGTVVWLCSDAAAFVTGIVVPVDGGFSAYAGV
jgi:NAD(P)-dependent dehydrogenase (short-subunit alcohol dehydrogenase family)